MGLRLREGMWVQSEGVVYDTWSDALHMIDAMPQGWHTWRKIRVIDFGYVNPFVCQWWAIDSDGRMYRYRELYMTKRTVTDHAAKINLLSQGETYEATICDHDAEDRATLRQCGISSINAIKDVSRGIQAVQARLNHGHDDKPRLFLLKGTLVERDSTLVEAKKPTSTEQECRATSGRRHPTADLTKRSRSRSMTTAAACPTLRCTVHGWPTCNQGSTTQLFDGQHIEGIDMPSVFDTFDLKRAQEIITSRHSTQAETNLKFLGGDHWQGGDAWTGPRPLQADPNFGVKMATIEAAQITRNVIAELCSRHTSGVLGRELHWGLTPAHDLGTVGRNRP